MSNPVKKPAPLAGGFFIAMGTIIGTLGGGYFYGQPSMGLLIGFGAGVAISLVMWLVSR